MVGVVISLLSGSLQIMTTTKNTITKMTRKDCQVIQAGFLKRDVIFFHQLFIEAILLLSCKFDRFTQQFDK